MEDLTIHGRLKPATDAVVPASCRVTATFRQSIDLGGDDDGTIAVPVSQTASVGADQTFTLDLAPKERIEGAIALAATAPDGTTAGTLSVAPADASTEVVILVHGRLPLPLTPSDDPTLGRSVRLTGRVMGNGGEKGAAGLLVVIWGIPEGGAQADARPLVITQTQKDGYFSGEWQPPVLASAFGTVSGGEPISIPLDADERLPVRVILVTDVSSIRPDDPCACGDVPPRAPDAIDLVNNPAAFSTDLGGGRCVNLNTPNRAVEEFSYLKVVRSKG